jgi:O-antigen/teichoic acid export membrane protein
MARAWFAQDHRTFWHLTHLNVGFAVLALTIYALFLSAFGPIVLKRLSGGSISYEQGLITALAIAVAFQGANVALGHAISAQLRQHTYGHIYLAAACLAVLLPFAMAHNSEPITAVAFGLAALEALILATLLVNLRQTRQSDNKSQTA